MTESVTTPDLIVPGIILGGAGSISLVLMLLAVAQWIKVAAARRWPLAEGTVVESRVVKSRDSHGAWSVRPLITYGYQVRGQTFTNNLLAFGARSVSKGGTAAEQEAHETVARYPVACQVAVHHHPSRPAQSVLEIRAASAKWMVLGATIFLAAGILAAGVVLTVNVAS